VAILSGFYPGLNYLSFGEFKIHPFQGFIILAHQARFAFETNAIPVIPFRGFKK
jgi:hypothetical protein